MEFRFDRYSPLAPVALTDEMSGAECLHTFLHWPSVQVASLPDPYHVSLVRYLLVGWLLGPRSRQQSVSSSLLFGPFVSTLPTASLFNNRQGNQMLVGVGIHTSGELYAGGDG